MAIEDVAGKILVTGGAGFIGSRLVHALLERGLRVRVLDIRQGPLKREKTKNLEFIGLRGNPLTRGMVEKKIVRRALRDVDIIYHLAINWNGHSWRHRLPLADLFDANIRGTLNLLEEARFRKVRHFLFSSSIAVYGEDSRVIDEETVCKPELWNGDPGPAYGILKLATEKLCLMYYHHYELPVTVFRIDLVFSDDEELYVSGRMVDKVRKGESIEVPEGEGSSSIHVDEVVQAFLLATLNKQAYGHIFNLTNPKTYLSDYELYRFLAKTTGSRGKINMRKGLSRQGATMSIEKAGRILSWKPHKGKEDRRKAISNL